MPPAEPPTIGTDRLVLRNWRESDRLAAHFVAGIRERGWGMWAVERRDSGAFAGCVGIQPVTFEAWFTPAVEIGWRLARAQWGQGVATEAATASLEHAFGPLGVRRVVAFTVPANTRSLAVMRRLGMTLAGEFDHPRIPEGHRLRHHVLYAAEPSEES